LDAALAIPPFRLEGRLCGLSQLAQGARRQHCARRFRSFGRRDVFLRRARRFWPISALWKEAIGRSDCQTLFGIGQIPSDNCIRYIRDFLDEADPALL
jgi:hypothetical protein